MKEIIKTYFEKLIDNKKLLISIDMAFLIMGSFMIFSGMYYPICGQNQNNVRSTIGSICIAIWFIFFPALTRERKDKIMYKLSMHLIIATVNIVILWFEVIYFLNNMKNGILYKDILFCIGGVIVFTYLLYILVEFFITFLEYVKKLFNIIIPKIEEKQYGLRVVIEGITAMIAAITAFFVAMVALYQGIISFVKLFN